MGFDDEETQKSSYEIEQMLKGRAGEAGAWGEVVETPVYAHTNGEPSTNGGKRKLGQYDVEEEEDGETFAFRSRDKRPVRDPYDDDDWDPKAVLGGLKLKKREAGARTPPPPPPVMPPVEAETESGLDRSKWTGRLDLEQVGGPSGSEVKLEEAGDEKPGIPQADLQDIPPSDPQDVKPALAPVLEPIPDAAPPSENSISLFKKRRPVASRKK